MTTKAEALEAVRLLFARRKNSISMTHEDGCFDARNTAIDFINSTPEWQPIEKASGSVNVLGFVPCVKRGDRIEIVKLRDGRPFVVGSEFHFDRAPVTHFMPLPNPPITGEK